MSITEPSQSCIRRLALLPESAYCVQLRRVNRNATNGQRPQTRGKERDMEQLSPILAAVLGSWAALALAVVPGLSVIGLAAAASLLATPSATSGLYLPELLLPLVCGFVAGHAVGGILTTAFFAAPDESGLYITSPLRALLLQGRGRCAILSAGLGCLAAALMLLLLVGPGLPRVRLAVRAFTGEHGHWMAWLPIAFLAVYLHPRPDRLASPGWKHAARAFGRTAGGWLVFLMSGLLGLSLFKRGLGSSADVPLLFAPAIVGLFILPHVVLSFLHSRQPGEAPAAPSSPGRLRRIAIEACTGSFCGLGAGCFPVLTGSAAGLVASQLGHTRDRAAQAAAQGAARFMFYAFTAALVLPACPIPGGSAGAEAMVPGAIALGGAAACLLLAPAARLMALANCAPGNRGFTILSLAAATVFAYVLAGPGGIAGLVISCAVGMFALLHRLEPSGRLGLFLFPAACFFSAPGWEIMHRLGLI